MELKTYVFLYRRKGSFKRIPANQWRDFLDSKIAIPNIKKSEFRTTEIQILNHTSAPRALHAIKAWEITVDSYGFVENTHCNELPKPNLSIALSDLLPFDENSDTSYFHTGEIQLAAYVDALLSEPVKSSFQQIIPGNRDVEYFVDQMLA